MDLFNVPWARLLTPSFPIRLPAWFRVPVKPLPLSPRAGVKAIMTRVGTLHERVSSLISKATSITPASIATIVFDTRTANKRMQIHPAKRHQGDDTFLSSHVHQFDESARRPSEAQILHDIQVAKVQCVNNHLALHKDEPDIVPLEATYWSIVDREYNFSTTHTKRQRGEECWNNDIRKNFFLGIYKQMPLLAAARRDKRDAIDVKFATVIEHTYESDSRNEATRQSILGPEIELDFSDISERTEPLMESLPATPKTQSANAVTPPMPLSASPAVMPHTIEAAPPCTASPLSASSATMPDISVANSPRAASPLTTSTPVTPYSQGTASFVTAPSSPAPLAAAAPAAISQLAEAAEHKLDGFATNVVVDKMDNGRFFVRFKIPDEYAPLFKQEPVPDTPAESILSDLTATPATPSIFKDEDEDEDDAINRDFFRGFIERSKASKASPCRPALAERSPNQGSPEKVKTPEKVKAAAPSRRSKRLKTDAKAEPKADPLSSSPTPIRVNSRSGAGRAKPAKASDVPSMTRANTRKNKGSGRTDTLARIGAELLASPVARKALSGGKTVHWKTPVEEEPPKRVTRSRAKKIAAARA